MNTWTEINAAFEDITGDTGNMFWSALVRVDMAGAALAELSEETRYCVKVRTNTTSSGVGYVDLSGDNFAVLRVEYDDEALFPITSEDLRTHDRVWSSRTGYPRFYYLDTAFADASVTRVGLYEVPGEAKTVRTYCTAAPNTPSLLSPSAELDIPEWACGAVLFYMLAWAYEADTKLQNFNTAAMYRTMYEDIKGRLSVRGRDHSDVKWVGGQPARPSLSVLNRLPERITP